jgi:hypothetical protein
MSGKRTDSLTKFWAMRLPYQLPDWRFNRRIKEYHSTKFKVTTEETMSSMADWLLENADDAWCFVQLNAISNGKEVMPDGELVTKFVHEIELRFVNSVTAMMFALVMKGA